MTENELIGKVRKLRQIKPRKDWVVLTKRRILGEHPTLPGLFLDSLKVFPRIVFQYKLAFASLIVILILGGSFGFAQISLPGDFLFPLKKITEKTRALFVSEEEKPAFQFELVNKRLEELTKVAETNRVRNLASALSAFEETKIAAKKEISNLIKNKSEEEAIKIAKELAPELNAINEREEQVLATLNIELEEVPEPPEKSIVELLVKDLETRTLTEEDQEDLAKAKEDLEAGDYSEALIKILNLSQR